MGNIRILPPQEAQKIAAGEVVERPANVVKELLENALDAGTLHTSLMLFEGGKKSITIIDSGCGMSHDDVRLAIQNHATSKLTSVDELQSIRTFGFRGEALASIAAVSHMTITTRTSPATAGIKLTIADGKIVSEEVVACNIGTTITIDDLFYNLPARKKFLKKEETEWNAIYHIFQAICLAHYDRSFTLFHNDHRVIHAPAVHTVPERIAQLFDVSLAQRMMSCTIDKNGISISGTISHPTHHRYDRNQIFLFVNNRWVKNHKLVQALLKGYASVLPSQRYPSAAIFVTIDLELVDINIHPRKEEVQFLHPKIVEDLVQNMVHSALQREIANDLETQAYVPVYKSVQKQETNTPVRAEPKRIFQNNKPNIWSFGKKDTIPAPHIIQAPQQKTVSVDTPAEIRQQTVIYETEQEQQSVYRLIGQILETYIIIETNEGIVLIDQHAAHERILYDLFAKNFDNVATTQLMFPQLISLAAEDYSIIEPYLSLFEKHGIMYEKLNTTQLLIKALPIHLKHADINEFFKAAAGWIHESNTLDTQEFHRLLHDKLRAMMACKAAIKAGDILNEQQMHELIEKLHKTENRMTCPHGRPTTWKVTKNDIERRFKRIE